MHMGRLGTFLRLSWELSCAILRSPNKLLGGNAALHWELCYSLMEAFWAVLKAAIVDVVGVAAVVNVVVAALRLQV
eukprot:4882471-Pyramimonas_sp.AAC.1